MVIQLPEDDLLHVTKTWLHHSTGELLACKPGSSAAPVRDEELTRYHPLLARALHASLDWKDATSARNHSLEKNTVLTILDMLHGAGFAFTDYFGNDQFLGAVNSVTQHHHGWIILYGSSVNHRIVVEPTGNFPIVTDVTWSYHTATREELELRRPGWEDRLKIGEALNLTAAELAAYVFTTDKNTLDKLPILELTFDYS